MNRRRSLDDTCDIFLSRRHVRSPPSNQPVANEYPHHLPPLRAENIGIPPVFFSSGPFKFPEVCAAVSTPASAKPLPLPGSSGALQAKETRMANGRRHVPRPRNPFILFRCDLVHQRKELPRSDLDDTNISRIAGDLWREMTAAQKRPWVELAAQEKARHALLYPDYKYAPAQGGSKPKKTKNDNAHLEERPLHLVSRMDAASPLDHSKPRRQIERPRPYPMPRRRSVSCPPAGAAPSPTHPPLEGWVPTSSQDDMQRDPSGTVMYQLATPQPVVEPVAPEPDGYTLPSLDPQGVDWLGFPQIDPVLLDSTCAFPDMSQNLETYAAPNCGFLEYDSTFSHNVVNPGFTLQELKDMERLAIEAMFTDPFATPVTIPMDNGSPYTYATAISPFDCSGYSTSSVSSPSSGTLSSY